MAWPRACGAPQEPGGRIFSRPSLSRHGASLAARLCRPPPQRASPLTRECLSRRARARARARPSRAAFVHARARALLLLSCLPTTKNVQLLHLGDVVTGSEQLRIRGRLMMVGRAGTLEHTAPRPCPPVAPLPGGQQAHRSAGSSGDGGSGSGKQSPRRTCQCVRACGSGHGACVRACCPKRAPL